ncbi:MAG: histidinol-phosphate transaminase [Raineya sp.]|nr:histidinol-phosphate transaminase [Raineya sp.]MDW8296146.1 histidinol-phosphate transaminase [Raineya sp.]
MFEDLLRPHILKLEPYSSARDEYSGEEGIFLDANENPIGSVTAAMYNRYPDPYQKKIKEKLAVIKGVKPENIFLGNGSDEAIDLLIRAFCEPYKENILIMPPTYGMYEVSANVNAVGVVKVPLNSDFQINIEAIQKAITPQTKIIFICSPNNPSGNLLSEKAITEILENFQGITLLDEAYIDFCPQATWLHKLEKYPRLVVIQTFSKAWGLAALRLGMAFAHPEIIAVLNKIKPPYNISKITQDLVLDSLQYERFKNEMVSKILEQRKVLETQLAKLPFVEKVYPSDANFLLVKMQNAQSIFEYLLSQKIIVRNRVKIIAGCLRISVGTKEENQILLEKLRQW